MPQATPFDFPHDDTPVNKVPLRAVFQGYLSELLHGRSVDAMLSEPRKCDRTALLLLKTHTVGPVTLDLPNLVALRQIQQITADNPLDELLESLFILANQQNEDVLFLRGEARQKAIAAVGKQYSAAQLPAARIALLEILDAVQKKTLNSLERMDLTTNALMQQLSGQSCTKPTDSQPPTGSAT
jgi:hypothetical protein